MLRRTLRWWFLTAGVLATVIPLGVVLMAILGWALAGSLPPKSIHAWDIYDKEKMTKVLNATVGLETKDGLARGYFDSTTGLLITNRHVVIALCPSRDCRDINLGSKNYGFEVLPSRGWNVLRCVDSIDLCVLEHDDVPRKGSQLEAIASSVGDELFVLTEKFGVFDNSRLLSGKITSMSLTRLETTVPSRKGYSGSPLFDRQGRLRGILTGMGNMEVKSSLAYIWDLWVHRYGEYGEAEILSAAAIQDVLLCPLSRQPGCLRKELAVFHTEIAKAAATPYSSAIAHFMHADFALRALNQLCSGNTANDKDARNLQLLCASIPAQKLADRSGKLRLLLKDPFWYKTYSALVVANDRVDRKEYLNVAEDQAPTEDAKIFVQNLKKL